MMALDFTRLAPTKHPSTAVEAVGYQDGHLLVRFNHKGKASVYSYAAVPLEIYERLMDAKSPGRFMAAEVMGKFDHTKHELGEAA